jgi:hypothetical protein
VNALVRELRPGFRYWHPHRAPTGRDAFEQALA